MLTDGGNTVLRVPLRTAAEVIVTGNFGMTEQNSTVSSVPSRPCHLSREITIKRSGPVYLGPRDQSQLFEVCGGRVCVNGHLFFFQL